MRETNRKVYGKILTHGERVCVCVWVRFRSKTGRNRYRQREVRRLRMLPSERVRDEGCVERERKSVFTMRKRDSET